MTTQPTVIRQSELLNQLVLNRDTMEELGRIDILWMYAPANRVLGFVSKSGFLGGKKLAFKLTQISALGANGVLTHDKPEETNAEKVSKLETLIHCEVWSDSGEKVGKIIDYIFNLKTGEISKYLFVSSGLGGVTGEVYELAPTQILSLGRRRVLVPNYAINSFAIYREGIKQKLTKAGEFLKEEKTQVTEELKTLSKRAQEGTEQAKGRFFNLTGQLRARAHSLAEQAKETIQTLNEQLQEEAQILAEQARERSQTLAEQVREQSQNLSEQVEDGIQTLTVQAREILDPDEEEVWEPPSELKTDADPEDFFDALFREERAEEDVGTGGQRDAEKKAEGRFQRELRERSDEQRSVERGQRAEDSTQPSDPIQNSKFGSADSPAANIQNSSSHPTVHSAPPTSYPTEPVAIADDPLDPWMTPPNSSAERSNPAEAIAKDSFESPWEANENPDPGPSSEPIYPSEPIAKSPPIEEDDEPWV
ncbi:PRC-barrel domain-containing protein [Kovacikia minuta CCNUW1]|uniref:PRC-barrel domain-containing protein n=1 Tax=Kovacikia minuta TaxID=2931930 RepID=UPI001CCDD90F|nr:PRC-barrel domain-containing protein [Kovacikia minuta]UBF25281.1 PRC-barrel domain-containing protein [Kovacikia minuta CCNUW1]